jgi:hypothetical protein
MKEVSITFTGSSWLEIRREAADFLQDTERFTIKEAFSSTRSFADTPVEPPLPPNPAQTNLLDDIEEEAVPTEDSINPKEAVLDAAQRYGKKYGTRQLKKLLKAYGADRARDLASDQMVPFINATIRSEG